MTVIVFWLDMLTRRGRINKKVIGKDAPDLKPILTGQAYCF
jgi:hypothetical protein